MAFIETNGEVLDFSELQVTFTHKIALTPNHGVIILRARSHETRSELKPV